MSGFESTKDGLAGAKAAAGACERHEIRCVCRGLLAIRNGDVLELKCRRCKRVLRLRLDERREFVASSD